MMKEFPYRATENSVLTDAGMTLELTFHSEANDELPYSTQTLFSHMMIEDGDDGKTVAVGFEEMARTLHALNQSFLAMPVCILFTKVLVSLES